MLRFFARFYAKRRYIWHQELEAATHDLNASLSALRAKEKRALVTQLNAEADAIEKNIQRLSDLAEVGYWVCENGHERGKCPCASLRAEAIVHSSGCGLEVIDPLKDPKCAECGKQLKFIKRSEMSGQEQYEADKEKKDAQNIAESKRQAAAEEEKLIEGGEGTAKHFRQQAANGRATAEKLRKL
jgi:hypothetical protein